jgi:TP901 family phage tail tape measure protein
MGGAAKTLTLELTGRNAGLGRMFSDSGRQVGAFQKQVESSNRSLSGGAIAAKGMIAGAAALAAGLGYAITKAAAFDKAMRNVNSLSKLNETQFKAMEKQVISMSTKLPQSATTLAEGLYDIASSGFQGADGIKVLDAAARSASAGLTSTATSSKAITAVLNAYGLKAKDAADVSDVLFSTVNLGVISFDELANNLGDVVGATAAAKVGIDEVGAAIATMTLSGIKGAQATTSLSSLTTKLVQPSTALAELYDKLGYKSGAAALETKGLHGVMEDLRVATGGNITTMLQLFPDIEAARGALALMANDGANYTKVADQITDKTKRMGATQAVLDEQMKGVSAQWQLFTNRIDAAAITVGVQLLPKLTQGMKIAGDFGSAVGKMASELKDKGASGLDNLGTSAENVKKFLEELGKTVISAGKAIGDAVGDDVVDTFNQLAAALAAVTGFALDNQGAVIALGLAYGIHALGGVQALSAGIGILSGGFSKATDIFVSLVTPRLEAGADIFDKIGDRAKAAGSKAKAAFLEVAPAAAIGGVLALAVTAWQGYSEAAQEAGDITKGTQRVMSSFKVDDLAGELAKAQAFISDFNTKVEEFGNSDHKIDLSTLLDVKDNYKLLGMADNLGKVQAAADATSLRLGQMQYNTVELFKVMGKPLPDAAKWINDVQGANGVVAQNVAMGQMSTLLDQLGPKLKAAGVDMGAAWSDQQMVNAVNALRGVKDGSEQAAAAQTNLIQAMGGAEDALSTTADAADKLKTALDGLMGASLGIDKAQIDWRNGLASLNAELDKNGATLSLNSQKGRDNRAAVITQVESLQDLLVAGANAGESQAQLTARLMGGRQALIAAGTAAKIPKDAMVALLAQYKLTPELVQTLIKESGSKPTKAALAEVIAQAKLVDKQKPKPTVTAKTAGAQAALDRVNHMLDTLDGKTANTTVTNTTRNLVITERSAKTVSGPAGGHVTTEADGGIINSYADGKLPNQAVIMQPKGDYGMVQWAEKSTGGEAFIPLANSKRGRSEQILSTVADKFGLALVAKFANGGFRYPAFKYPAYRYDPKGAPRVQQTRQYFADKAQKYTEYQNARYAAYEEWKDRAALAQTAAGRGAGAFHPGMTASDTFTNLGASAEARAQAKAELKAKTSRSPSDDAADYYRKPTISLKEYMAALKQAETYQRQWNHTLSDLSSKVGSDVVKSLQGMGDEGEAIIRKMATASVADMKKMAAQIRGMEFTKFFSDTASNVKGQAQFQANLQALVKMGRADLASKFEDMGYDSAAGLAATAVTSPGSTLTQLTNMLNQQEAFNDPKMQDAFKLAKLIQASGGKLGVMGLAQSSGTAIGDVLGLLAKYETTVFGKIPVAAMKQIRTDQALLRSGKQPSGLAMGAIVPGSDTGYYWAEKSSGGESLIPHGLDRRKRALDLWQQTGRILGAGSAGGSSYVTIAPGAISLTIPINQPGASVGEIQAVAQRVVSGSMNDLARLLTAGRRS